MAQHLSIRIPWKDNGYDGRVCTKPCFNNACLRLANIAQSRNDELEEKLAGQPMSGQEANLPCIGEGGAFMSPGIHTRITVHPYRKSNSKSHGHFLETELVYPPYSLPARPFGWTMLRKGDERNDDNISRLAEMYGIDYDSSREPDLGFQTNWVQDATNQRAIFKRFYENVTPRKSLVVVYAKQVPFIEDAKRVVMGIGFVESVTEPPEHSHTDEGSLRSILWETMIGHSIRDERKDGFLLPYSEIMAYANEHPDFDMRSITVFSDDESFDEFSYATEHLSFDAAISVLLQTIKALKNIKQCIPGNWDECIAWTNARLEEVWIDRGAFPGAGIMLYTMGFKNGILIADEIKNSLDGAESFIAKLQQAIYDPKKYLSQDIAAYVTATEQNAFIKLNDERKALFWLLCRLSLTREQAMGLFNHGYDYFNYRGVKRRKEVNLDCVDTEILANPYLVFEKTRLLEVQFRIPLRNVDMAVFPPQILREIDPLAAPSAVENQNDGRRVRAIAVFLLERLAEYGHTVCPQANLITDINELPLEPYCTVTGDILNSLAEFFNSIIVQDEMKNGEAAYQLVRLQEYDEVIRNAVRKRVGGTRHEINEYWARIVNEAFGDDNGDTQEQQARQEKIAVLTELAESRLSVLIGGAGTGKTTLLALLCKSPKIQSGGVLLLAPTGNARVRMTQAMSQQSVRFNAKTVAQFLIRNGRFNYATMNYHLSNSEAKDVPDTVIVDECSMLTEEMFGALIQTLGKGKAQRIIFVGDPNQLPPIGAGRPFVDLVNHLKVSIPEFPRVGKSYGELTITRRQQNEDGSERFDTMLAEWYTNNNAELDSEIFAYLQANECGKNITFKTWQTAEELEQLVLGTVAEETGMSSIDDVDGFDISIGGVANGDWMNFGSRPQMIEGWQILSAYRNDPVTGTATMNRYIHEQYRKSTSATARYKKRSTRNILGTDGIVYGDKIINTRNQKKDGDPTDGCLNMVANGEVGIVERIWQKPKDKRNSHQIRFSSQPDYNYNWDSRVSDEGNNDIELAYALTVHKAQGSEFGKVILIVSEPSNMLSKELLYTAITRQKSKLVILYNGEAYHLRNYSSTAYSDIAQRFTNLFEKPDIVEYQKKFYENNLIHKTARGELVRSKSEVIIADALFDNGIEYEYEQNLDLGNDGKKSPDFTIEDADSGILFYWEHCGMMANENYRRRWESKREIYAKHGIVEGDNLIVSYDNKNGSIDSQEIRNLIEQYLK